VKRSTTVLASSHSFRCCCSRAPTRSRSASSSSPKGIESPMYSNGTSRYLQDGVRRSRQGRRPLWHQSGCFHADGDDVRFQDIVNQCAQQGYQGMIIPTASPSIPTTWSRTSSPRASSVPFDTVIADSAGKGVPASPPPSERSEMAASPSTTSSTSSQDRPDPSKCSNCGAAPAFPLRQETGTYLKYGSGKIKTLEVLAPPIRRLRRLHRHGRVLHTA